MGKKIPRYRRFVFTLFGNDTKDLMSPPPLSDINVKHAWFRAYGGQLEIGEETKRLHFQGRLYMNRKSSCGYVHNHIFPSMNVWIQPEWNEDGSVGYVQKSATKYGPYQSVGEMPRPGTRNDIHDFMLDVKDHGVREAALKHPDMFAKYHAGAEKFHKLITKKPKYRKMYVEWIWGEGGLRKTHYAACIHGEENVFEMTEDSKGWYDTYEGEPVLLLDEFDPSWMTSQRFRNTLEGHPHRISIKGTMSYARWFKVYITSNKPPHEVLARYNLSAVDQRACMRRIHKISHWTEVRRCVHCDPMETMIVPSSCSPSGDPPEDGTDENLACSYD